MQMTDREVMSVLHESHVWSQPVVGGGQLSHQIRRPLIQMQRPLGEQKPAPAHSFYYFRLEVNFKLAPFVRFFLSKFLRLQVPQVPARA